MKNIFASPLFVLALSLLLLNDFFLKYYFHNAFTGKLSDFAGLFIFPIFWSVFFPTYKRKIFFLTALIFVWWKSPLSEGFIHLLNTGIPLGISRVVDYSDLMALGILPFSYLYLQTERKWRLKIHPGLVVCIAAFSFIATSQVRSINTLINQTYEFTFSKRELKHRLANHPYLEISIQKNMEEVLHRPSDYQYYNIDSNFTDTNVVREKLLDRFIVDSLDFINFKLHDTLYLELEIAIEGNENTSLLHIKKCAYSNSLRKPKDISKGKLISIIEKYIITPIKNANADEF